MADYFPLITRAVTSLDPNTRERREAIYARAREALDRQLLSLDPPIGEPDLRRERGALEATIRRVEAQFAPAQPAFRADAEKPSGPLDRGGAAERIVAGAHPVATDETPEPPQPEPAVEVSSRPKIEVGPRTSIFASGRLRMAMAIGLPLVVLIAIAAYVMRDDPGRYTAQPQQPPGESASVASGRKSDGRLDGTGAGPAAGPRPAPEQPVLPVASRVLFFEEAPNDPRGVQSDGVVVWRLEPTQAAPGRPADQAIRGSISVAGANMAAELVVKRNRDGALPASHTIELIFRPEAGRDGVKEISPIEARDQETNPGAALLGPIVPVGVNLFLIGLERTDASLSRNIESMRDRKWFAFQFRLVSGKVGAMLIEKGATGDRVFREAIEAWK